MSISVRREISWPSDRVEALVWQGERPGPVEDREVRLRGHCTRHSGSSPWPQDGPLLVRESAMEDRASSRPSRPPRLISVSGTSPAGHQKGGTSPSGNHRPLRARRRSPAGQQDRRRCPPSSATSSKYQFVVNRLNEVLGVGSFRAHKETSIKAR